MPYVDFTKEECKLIAVGMSEGIEQAEAELTAFKVDAPAADITAALIARSMMMMIKDKMDKAARQA